MITLEEVYFAEYGLTLQLRGEVLECADWIAVIRGHAVEASVVAAYAPTTVGFGGYKQWGGPLRLASVTNTKLFQFSELFLGNGQFLGTKSPGPELDRASFGRDVVKNAVLGVLDCEGRSDDIRVFVKQAVVRVVDLVDESDRIGFGTFGDGGRQSVEA